MLAIFCNETQDDWDNHLPYIMMAYRASVQESIRMTPNRIILGREINLPIDLMAGTLQDLRPTAL